MTDSALTRRRKRTLLLPLLIVITLIACAGAGYAWWRLQHQDTSQSLKNPPPAAPVFYALETFTVNLGDADRVLYIGITLRLKDEETRRRMNDFLPEVRSRLILLFSRQDGATLATDKGKQALIQDIKDTLKKPLVREQPDQIVTDVLYTAFILR
ncbi:flagellar basal body-associated protein FliL [Entomohabitans teleogrylli]|uniref:flagellar basal body-associated protein FliL n=1 Tax=Entomohabitans teleogrylli TaxID=1384589 RepID=UPI00073D5687|nr:flagellar basal body-associated protein FliL [Entomohabitans teleogrylli]